MVSHAMCAVLIGSSIVTFDVNQSLAAGTKKLSGRETLNFNTWMVYIVLRTMPMEKL